jgi:hypothetical protein
MAVNPIINWHYTAPGRENRRPTGGAGEKWGERESHKTGGVNAKLGHEISKILIERNNRLNLRAKYTIPVEEAELKTSW